MSEKTTLTESTPEEKAPETEAAEPKKKAALTDKSFVSVKNGFSGELIYKSARTGEVYRWEKEGEEAEMPMSELKLAKSTAKGFFEKRWFLFDDSRVPKYLGVEQFYKK